ncbi:MAG TPA: hypothetical protein VK796_02370, partial [Cytophaga sp.]|nr:hypothetical protein [Cytophaga sp.]
MLKSFINENKKQYFLLSLVCCTLFVLIQWALLPESYTSDTADGIWHYLLARYSYWNPAFELDLWAKPVFTILAAPFAQFGLKGIHLMQIICSFLTSIVLFKISDFFNIKHLWLIPVLLFFTPIYFPELFSGLTEIVFAFFLVWGIYLVVINEWFFAAVLFSFLPFVRQEGYFIFPLMGLLLLIQKKYFYIPLLFTGYILITFYGYSTHHSLMWIANNNPYKGAQDIYGKGELFFYINALDELLGTSRKVLFYIGGVLSLYTLTNGIFTFRKNNIPDNKLFHFHFITLGFIILFIAAESIFWKFGLFGAMGMHRLITCIVPLIVLIIIFGLDVIYSFASKYSFRKIYIVTLSLLTVFFINVIFKMHYWPLQLQGETIVVAEACEWYKKTYPNE